MYMQTITLYLPKEVEAEELRQDLEETIFRYRGKFRKLIPFELPYGVGQERTYEISGQGSIVTLTNDLNVFRQETFYVPGGVLYYTAKILLLDFDEGSYFFEALRQNFEYFNNRYEE